MSHDINPLDFIVGLLKRSFISICHFKIEIITNEICEAITPDMIKKVIKTFNQITITRLESDCEYIEICSI